jgi:DNA polymerase-3 subunit beta
MELIIDKKILMDVLDKIAKVIPAKPAIASTGGILLEAKKDGITLTATDLQLTLKLFLECTVKDKTDVLIPGKKIISLIREIPEEKVKIATGESGIIIEDKNFQYKFLIMDINDYPKLPSDKDFAGDENTLNISSEVFQEMITRTAYCINPDEPRIYFRGVLIDLRDGHLNMVATDTRRLSLVRKPMQTGKKMKLILPQRLLEVLPSIVKEGEMTISFTKNQIRFQTDRVTLISQLLEGEFPDYMKVIPPSEKLSSATIEAKQLLSSLERLVLLSSDTFNSVKMSFRRDMLVLNIESPQLGTGEEKLKIQYSGPDATIIFNPVYFIQFLKTVPQETVTFSFADPLKPARLNGTGADDYIYVVMPIKP